MDEIVRRRQIVQFRRYAPDRTFTLENAMIELEINISELFRTLGEKAARSTGRRAVEAGGLVKATRR